MIKLKSFYWKFLILLLFPWHLAAEKQDTFSGLRPSGTGGITVVIEDPTGTGSPVCIRMLLEGKLLKLSIEGKLYLTEKRDGHSSQITVQYERRADAPESGFLSWQMPSGRKGQRTFVLEGGQVAAPSVMMASKDAESGQLDISESGQPVLRYVYETNGPGAMLKSIHPNNHKYAWPRSDYIHPLYGLDGEVLTKDWAVDHPHHRGIYWAWPETFYRGENGDLHALQRVFARPTGKYRLTQGPVYAQIEAENTWLWEDHEPIVHETTMIRSYALGPEGRCIDVKFIFTALKESVTIARRGTDKYGGLNIRLAETAQQEFLVHTDPAHTKPRMAWSDFLGVFRERKKWTGFAVLQRQSNPEYPGDWVQYPALQWLQPTFPSAGNRYELKKGRPIELQYRFWIRSGGKLTKNVYADQWRNYNQLGGL